MNHHAIHVEDLHYTYPPPSPHALSLPALRGIDLVVEKGEFLAVMGPTGAGKTTFCLALNGLVPQSTGGIFRGNVWVAGLNTKTQPVAELAAEVGVVFQESESQLFNMTVEDEVAFGPESLGLPAEEIERRTRWALEAVGLAELGDRSPAHLSGGQQRRLAIAAVLAMQPGLLVLDEPTAGLDPPGRRAVLDVILELRRQGSTVVMATQDAEVAAALAGRVVLLEAGRIVADGTPQEVLGQVERLHALGVDVPQMAELSHRLGICPPWLTVDQAFQALSGQLAAPPSLPPSLPTEGREGRPGQASPQPPAPSLTFENVYYHYVGAGLVPARTGLVPARTGLVPARTGLVPALAGLDLALSAGEYVALIGANGSGKSTLAKHAGGLLRPQQGRVLVTGRDTRLISTGELARQVGHVFQNPDHQIFAATVWEEIAFGPRNLGLRPAEVQKRVQAALAAFHLASVADLPPTTLGYGQRRLVTLAAVHAMQPQVLILDEPTAGLDRRLTARLVEWVSELHASGATVVLITHDMRLASLAPRCVVMDHGRVVLDGPTAQVFTHLPVLAQAGIAPPPIVELSRRLRLPAAPLSLDDFCRAFAQRVNQAGAP